MSIKRSIYQGDSYAEDFTSPDIPTFDANYSGTWALLTALGAAATISGALTKSADNTTLQLRITPAQTEAIAEMEYILVAQVKNDSIGFKQEILHEKFEVKPQGITG